MTANPSPRALFAESLLQGRVALITGGGTGICRGIALAMACMQMKARADSGPQAPHRVQAAVAAAQPGCAASFRPTT